MSALASDNMRSRQSRPQEFYRALLVLGDVWATSGPRGFGNDPNERGITIQPTGFRARRLNLAPTAHDRQTPGLRAGQDVLETLLRPSPLSRQS